MLMRVYSITLSVLNMFKMFFNLPKLVGNGYGQLKQYVGWRETIVSNLLAVDS